MTVGTKEAQCRLLVRWSSSVALSKKLVDSSSTFNNIVDMKLDCHFSLWLMARMAAEVLKIATAGSGTRRRVKELLKASEGAGCWTRANLQNHLSTTSPCHHFLFPQASCHTTTTMSSAKAKRMSALAALKAKREGGTGAGAYKVRWREGVNGSEASRTS